MRKNTKLRCVINALMGLGVSFLAQSTLAGDDSEANFVPSELIVKFKNPSDVKSITLMHTDLKFEHQPSGITLVYLPTKTGQIYDPSYYKYEIEEYQHELEKLDGVEYVEKNIIFQLNSFTPNDPLYPALWNMNSINAPAAWGLTRGASRVKIGVIDSGRGAHPDLNWSSSLAYNGVTSTATLAAANENNIKGYNHGTHVAGIIGAKINNGVGLSGVCGDCDLIPIRANTHDGDGLSTTGITNGIKWAIDNELQVLNMSFSTAGTCASRPTIAAGIQDALAAGITVVVAAGNHGSNAANYYPGSCPGVITVGAIDRNGDKTSYSNYGTPVDVVAPGGSTVPDTFNGQSIENFWGAQVNAPGESICSSLDFFYPQSNFVDGILSTWRHRVNAASYQNCYRLMSGTSMAAPHVTGVIGLMLSRKAALTPAQLRSIVRSTATSVPSCPAGHCGTGKLNAYAAVNHVTSLQTGPCASAGSTCAIDAITNYRNSTTGEAYQYIHAYNRIWKASDVGTINGNVQSIAYMDKYNGSDKPCSYSTNPPACKLDTLTVIDYPGWGYIEAITAYGRAFNIGKDGTLVEASRLLSSVPRYSSGPCSFASGSSCNFETRVLFDYPGIGFMESINAYGRYFNYNLAGALVDSGITKSVPRYAAGPCAGLSSSAQCNFQSRSLRVNNFGEVIEIVIAYGKYYEWKNDVVVTSGAIVKDMAKFK